MISRKHFAAQIKKLNTIYPDSAINDEQAALYYEAMSPDFNDEQFDKALNLALKNSFKFPPIAAFYHRDPLADVLQGVYSPVTAEESKLLRATMEKVERDANAK
jgi:2-oxo-4-hydroxy-4-carboxy--5-ureidoimidazoline (OHCU) decarboxylase